VGDVGDAMIVQLGRMMAITSAQAVATHMSSWTQTPFVAGVNNSVCYRIFTHFFVYLNDTHHCADTSIGRDLNEALLHPPNPRNAKFHAQALISTAAVPTVGPAAQQSGTGLSLNVCVFPTICAQISNYT